MWCEPRDATCMLAYARWRIRADNGCKEQGAAAATFDMNRLRVPAFYNGLTCTSDLKYTGSTCMSDRQPSVVGGLGVALLERCRSVRGFTPRLSKLVLQEPGSAGHDQGIELSAFADILQHVQEV
eukprot:365696-Chlamydomonas_euryale.AAC.1